MVWAHGKKKDHPKCATGADKSPKCTAGGWTVCGTNDYPAGRLLRDAKLYEIGAGTSEIRRMLIGRELFGETA